MIKWVGVFRRRPDISSEEFARHWREKHAPLVLKLPGLRGYIQSPVVSHSRLSFPFDGIGEVWYDNPFQDFAVAQALSISEPGGTRWDPLQDLGVAQVLASRINMDPRDLEAIIEDERRFIDSYDWALCEEHVVIPPPRSSSTPAEGSDEIGR